MKTPETGNNRTGLASASSDAREGVDSMVAAQHLATMDQAGAV